MICDFATDPTFIGLEIDGERKALASPMLANFGF